MSLRKFFDSALKGNQTTEERRLSSVPTKGKKAARQLALARQSLEKIRARQERRRQKA